MDEMHFDQLTKRLGTSMNARRGLLQLGLGSGLAALAFAQVADDALACRRNGKPCVNKKKNGGCCSGTCRRGTCRPTPDAFGCTVHHPDVCQNQNVLCPKNPRGNCVKLDNGKPFCQEHGMCQACTSNASCTQFPNGKCLKTCPICPETNNQACAYTRI